MVVSVILFIIYVLLGTSTNLIGRLYDNSEWLKRTYHDFGIDIEDEQGVFRLRSY